MRAKNVTTQEYNYNEGDDEEDSGSDQSSLSHPDDHPKAVKNAFQVDHLALKKR